MIDCHERLQPLGYLAWAACGKDPGFTPLGILEQARRTARYTDDEVSALVFESTAPSAADLSRRWRQAVETAEPIFAALPADQVGHAVCTADGQLFIGRVPDLTQAAAAGGLYFHKGRIGGAWPTITS